LKKLIQYAGFVIKKRPSGFLASCFLYLLNLLFAAGLYAMASLIISLSALHPTYDNLMIPVVCVRMFGLGRAVLSYGERYFSHDNTFHILKDLRLKLYDAMVPVLPDYETRRSENLSKFIADVELLQEGILRLIYPFASSLLIMVIGTLIAYWIHPVLSIIFVGLFVVNYYIFPGIMFYLNDKKKNTIDYDKQKLYQEMLEVKEGINEITSDGREDDWLKKIQDQLSQMNGTLSGYQSSIAFCEAMITFLQGASVIFILFTATYLTSRGELKGIYLAAGTLALATIVNDGILSSQTYIKFIGLRRAVNTIFEVKSSQNKKEAERYLMPADSSDAEIEKVLKISNLSWGYKNSKVLFHNLSFEVKKGSIVAVVGKSGCGKSSLVNLILGFLKPTEGKIVLGSKDLSRTAESERLKLFSVVDQTPFFFHQTIFENLKLADSEADEARMIEVLKSVKLDQLILNSKLGLHTLVYEWGSNFSGGELQRLAIARALLRKAEFYIFDEPTAGLDTMNEKIIMDLIYELSKEHGILLVTHRMKMLEQVNSVIYISDD